MSWFNKGFTTRALSADQLDAIVQKLAKNREMWLDFGSMPNFTITAQQYWYDTEPGIECGASYKIHFPASAWKKLNRRLSNQEMMAALLLTEEGGNVSEE